jgi:hypothetical protein
MCLQYNNNNNRKKKNKELNWALIYALLGVAEPYSAVCNSYLSEE